MTVYNQSPNNVWLMNTAVADWPDEQIEADYEIVDPAWTMGYDHPMRTQDPVQQRMMLILLFVLLGAVLFILLALPRIRQNGAQTAVPAVAAAPAPQTDDVIAPLFTAEVQYWEPKIAEWATLYGVDPNMVATVMQIESCGDPQALSIAGAQGLFQVMPFHFQPGEDAFHPDTNAMRGMTFLADLVEQFGQPGLAFAGYNGGPGNAVKSYEFWPNETQRYYYWGTGIYEDAAAGRAESATLNEWLAAGGAGGCARAAERLGLQ
jgi:soluble lytic murein transglycosylase-like protein